MYRYRDFLIFLHLSIADHFLVIDEFQKKRFLFKTRLKKERSQPSMELSVWEILKNIISNAPKIIKMNTSFAYFTIIIFLITFKLKK